MTDNEIIKALEHCRDNGCAGCPLEFMEDDKGCMTEWLDLINRQKAEIERLKELAYLATDEADNLRDLYFEEKSERAKAIKEFAERAKTKADANEWDGTIIADGIDNLVKEMVGADNG